ncbi:MAG: hypothetical protein WAW96_12125 [Alphaproteobacteria bacterium]
MRDQIAICALNPSERGKQLCFLVVFTVFYKINKQPNFPAKHHPGCYQMSL